jgi:hypothetical protein
MKDAEAKKVLEAGRKQQMAAALPEDLRGESEGKKILRAAFISGKRAAAVSATPMELTPAQAAQFEKAKAAASAVAPEPSMNDEQKSVFELGADVEKARALADLVEVEDSLGNHRIANDLRTAIAKGKGAAQLLAVPDELAENPLAREAFQRGADGADITVAMRNDRAALGAYQKGPRGEGHRRRRPGRLARRRAAAARGGDLAPPPAAGRVQAGAARAGRRVSYRGARGVRPAGEEGGPLQGLRRGSQGAEGGRHDPEGARRGDRRGRVGGRRVPPARHPHARGVHPRPRGGAHGGSRVAEELPETADPKARKEIHAQSSAAPRHRSPSPPSPRSCSTSPACRSTSASAAPSCARCSPPARWRTTPRTSPPSCRCASRSC